MRNRDTAAALRAPFELGEPLGEVARLDVGDAEPEPRQPEIHQPERRAEGVHRFGRALPLERQRARLAAHPGHTVNATLQGRALQQHCALDATGRRLLHRAAEKLQLSARGFHRVLRVARTIALAGADRITPEHLAEALQYRMVE